MSKVKNFRTAKDCIERAKSIIGPGWSHVSKEIQWGLISSEILYVFLLQDESIGVDQIHKYIKGVTAEALLLHGEK